MLGCWPDGNVADGEVLSSSALGFVADNDLDEHDGVPVFVPLDVAMEAAGHELALHGMGETPQDTLVGTSPSAGRDDLGLLPLASNGEIAVREAASPARAACARRAPATCRARGRSR